MTLPADSERLASAPAGRVARRRLSVLSHFRFHEAVLMSSVALQLGEHRAQTESVGRKPVQPAVAIRSIRRAGRRAAVPSPGCACRENTPFGPL
jgi:hypothetical protein